MPVHLLDPRGLWLLAGLAPLVLLYVLKTRRTRQRVPSTWLWEAAQRDLRARHPFRRLVAEVPLLLQGLALAALAIALARPSSGGRTIEGDHVAIVIDTSASMAARTGRADSTTTRIAEAKRAASDILARLGPGADALVIEAAHDARVVAPLDRDIARLQRALDAVTSRDEEGRLAAAVALAADRLRSLGGLGRLVIITDGALAGEEALAVSGVPTQVIAVGDAQENAAIVRLDVRSGVDGASRREQVQVFATIQSWGERAREAYVTLALEGAAEPLASRRLLLRPGEREPVLLTFTPRPQDFGAAFTVQLSPGDALPGDDVAFGRVPPPLRMPVVVASDAPRSWMMRALEADSGVDLQRLTTAQLSTVNVDPDALVVVEGACPPLLPGRDALIVAPPAGACLGVRVGGAVDDPPLTSWEIGDPRLRFLTLDGVHVARSAALEAAGAGASLVRSSATTLVADASTPGRTATVVGFDVGESDWPLKASFVLFARNVVELARTHRAQGASGPLRTGEPARLAVPLGTTRVTVEGPGLPERDAPARDGFAVLPPLERAGIVHVRWSDPHVGSTTLAANLTSAAESDIRPRPVRVAGSDVTAGGSARPLDGRNEWSLWFAAIAALALAMDVWWMTRENRAYRRWNAAGLVLAAAGVIPLLWEGGVAAGFARESYVRFHRPLALVLAAGLSLFLAAHLTRLPPRPRAGGRGRRALVLLFSATASLAAAIAVAEPELGSRLDRLAVVLLVDRSRSVDLVPGAATRVGAEVRVAEQSMHDDDRIGMVVFGAGAAVEDPLRRRSEDALPQRAEVGRDATDIEAAVRRGLAELPSDGVGRLVLVSDGVQTRGDAYAAAAAASAAAVPIDVVPLDQKATADVRVVSVHAPSRVNEGEPLELRVVTSSARETDVELRVRRDDGEARAVRARIARGEDVLRLREPTAGPGLHRYDVAITALDPTADEAPDDNTGSAFVRVHGAALALVLEGDSGHGAPLRRALEASGFRTTERTSTGAPADVDGLAAYDLVVLSDVPASDLTAGQIAAVAAYTRDLGGGLLLMGGDRSMGPGGYARTPIEDVSPVAFDLKQEKRRASLAEVIAIDYSGSMGATVDGNTKLDLANEAAVRSASLLGPGDRLGVEHVDTAVRWTVPMAPVTDEGAIAQAIRGVGVGGGGIFTDIALRAGYEALSRESVNLKHLLLFADGSDAEQIAGCRAIVSAAYERGITTSVISLGRGNDSPELEVLSKMGGGRFYLIEDATRLPAVFTQETILAARSAIHETPFRVTLGAPAPPTRGIDFAKQPSLDGYVVTLPKPRASTLLVGAENDPVLVTWSVGTGHAAAFTSDYKDRWGQRWLAWPDAARLFGQLARDVARGAGDPTVRLETDTAGGELHVRADVVGDDGRAQTFRRLTAHVAGPDGFARDVPLEAMGAGRYAATLPLARPGAYVTTARDETSGETAATTGSVLAAGEELRPTGSDRALLARVASMTGGRVRDTLAGLFDDRAGRRFAYASTVRFLVWISAVCMILGVAARRLGLPPLLQTAANRIGAWRAKRAHDRGGNTEQATPVVPRAAATPPDGAHAPAESVSSPTTGRPMTAAEKLVLKRRERR
jgi:uncharacterized membrane protein